MKQKCCWYVLTDDKQINTFCILPGQGFLVYYENSIKKGGKHQQGLLSYQLVTVLKGKYPNDKQLRYHEADNSFSYEPVLKTNVHTCIFSQIYVHGHNH